MKPKDLFHLAVRLLGLLFLYRGLSNLPAIFNGIGMAWLYIIFCLAAAWWLLTTHWLTKLAYSGENPDRTKTGEVPAGNEPKPNS